MCIIAVTKKKGGSNMNREELQEEIRFLYGLWYRYYLLYTFLRDNKKRIRVSIKTAGKAKRAFTAY